MQNTNRAITPLTTFMRAAAKALRENKQNAETEESEPQIEFYLISNMVANGNPKSTFEEIMRMKAASQFAESEESNTSTDTATPSTLATSTPPPPTPLPRLHLHRRSQSLPAILAAPTPSPPQPQSQYLPAPLAAPTSAQLATTTPLKLATPAPNTPLPSPAKEPELCQISLPRAPLHNTEVFCRRPKLTARSSSIPPMMGSGMHANSQPYYSMPARNERQPRRHLSPSPAKEPELYQISSPRTPLHDTEVFWRRPKLTARSSSIPPMMDSGMHASSQPYYSMPERNERPPRRHLSPSRHRVRTANAAAAAATATRVAQSRQKTIDALDQKNSPFMRMAQREIQNDERRVKRNSNLLNTALNIINEMDAQYLEILCYAIHDVVTKN